MTQRNKLSETSGPNAMLNSVNIANKLLTGASIEDICEAARSIASMTKRITAENGRLGYLFDQRSPHPRKIIEIGHDVTLDDEPDKDFKLWCQIGDAYSCLMGDGDDAFITAHRETFTSSYIVGFSVKQAYKAYAGERKLKKRGPLA